MIAALLIAYFLGFAAVLWSVYLTIKYKYLLVRVRHFEIIENDIYKLLKMTKNRLDKLERLTK